MKNLLENVRQNPLFFGVNCDEIEKMLKCLAAGTKHYKKDSVVLHAGGTIDFIGLILSGSVKLIHEDFGGHLSIVAELACGEIFGELFACAEISESPITIQTSEDAEILFIDYKCIVASCASACSSHATLIRNMLKIMASKNLFLGQKIEILSKRTTREKLMHYFDTQGGGRKEITIPFNREELANFLCVDRSAMSSELGKMRKEGLINFDKNYFEILY